MRVKLPEPRTTGGVSVEEALYRRRSTREFEEAGLTLSEVGQLLWSGYGITCPEGFRTAPSAMALYPLEFYVNSVSIDGLAPGVYRFDPSAHELHRLIGQSKHEELFRASFEQSALAGAPAILIISGIYQRTREKFGEAAPDFVHMDLGHAAQNIHLQAVSLGLGTVVIAAFRRDEVKRILELPEDETALYMMPVGRYRG